MVSHSHKPLSCTYNTSGATGDRCIFAFVKVDVLFQSFNQFYFALSLLLILYLQFNWRVVRDCVAMKGLHYLTELLALWRNNIIVNCSKDSWLTRSTASLSLVQWSRDLDTGLWLVQSIRDTTQHPEPPYLSYSSIHHIHHMSQVANTNTWALNTNI